MTSIKNSISYSLLFNVILIYATVTFLVTIAHVYTDFQYQKKHIQEELNILIEASNRSFSNAVWDMNKRQIEIETQGMIQIPLVKAIQIKDKNNHIILEKKDTTCDECLTSEFKSQSKLYRKIFDKNIYLGEIIIYSDTARAIKRVQDNLSFILLSAFIKSALIILLFIFAFKKYLQKPLTHIISQINNIDLEKKAHTPIHYESQINNEFVILTNSVNTMLNKIDTQVVKLQESEIQLQEDIKNKTQALTDSNHQLQNVIKGAKLGFWDWNLQNGYYEVNHRYTQMLGLSKHSIISENDWQERIHPEDRETILPQIIQTVTSNKTYTIEYRIKHQDGHYVWIEASGSLIQKDNLGQALRACGTHKDISTRKEAEIRISKQKNFLNTLIDNAPIPIFYKDEKGIYLGVNKRWNDMVGFTQDEILKKSVYDIAPKDIADIYSQQDEKVFTLEENPQIYKSVIVNKLNKEKFDVMFYKSAFFDETGNVAGLIGSILDLTPINQLQEEKNKQEKLLFEQSKLASMGEMIANISHQWRQPLSIISTYATGIDMHKKLNLLTDELLEESCEKINENAQYLSHTIDDFKSYIKGDGSIIRFNLEKQFVTFNSLISSIVKQENITIIMNTSEDIEIQGYPTQLLQCFINIFNNSKDAYAKNQKKLFFIHDDVKDEKNIIITFKDNAGGINEEIIDKIFEPYFTTKHKAQGTGLGLHMSYKLITQGMKGSIHAQNEEYTYEDKKYKGAKFTLIIPK